LTQTGRRIKTLGQLFDSKINIYKENMIKEHGSILKKPNGYGLVLPFLAILEFV